MLFHEIVRVDRPVLLDMVLQIGMVDEIAHHCHASPACQRSLPFRGRIVSSPRSGREVRVKVKAWTAARALHETVEADERNEPPPSGMYGRSRLGPNPTRGTHVHLKGNNHCASSASSLAIEHGHLCVTTTSGTVDKGIDIDVGLHDS